MKNVPGWCVLAAVLIDLVMLVALFALDLYAAGAALAGVFAVVGWVERRAVHEWWRWLITGVDDPADSS